MAPTESPSPAGACCFYETPRGSGREFGVGAEELHAVVQSEVLLRIGNI
jgi:hypothetical protein